MKGVKRYGKNRQTKNTTRETAKGEMIDRVN